MPIPSITLYREDNGTYSTSLSRFDDVSGTYLQAADFSHLLVQADQALTFCAERISNDENCGPQGLGALCMIQDVVKEIREITGVNTNEKSNDDMQTE